MRFQKPVEPVRLRFIETDQDAQCTRTSPYAKHVVSFDEQLRTISFAYFCMFSFFSELWFTTQGMVKNTSAYAKV